MEKKKKISVVDICVLILICVFAVGVGIRYASISKPVIEDKKLRYTVEVKNVRSYTVDALKQSDTVSDGIDNVYGSIVDVEVEDTEMESSTTTGELVQSKIPEKYDCYVTIVSDAKKKDNIYYLDAENSISVGESMEVITKYVKTSGTIVEVSEVE